MKMIIIENPNLNHNNENNIQIDIDKPNDINNFVNISDLNIIIKLIYSYK